MFPATKKPTDTTYRRTRPSSNGNANDDLANIFNEGMARGERGAPLSVDEQRDVMDQQRRTRASWRDMQSMGETDNYMRQMPRRWKTGDVYAPRDLSPAEMGKWRRANPPKQDILDVLGVNPVDNYKNFALISGFMSPMGRIQHSSFTGLRPVNQRKMAKAVRRAVGMGLHPSVHHHPEILRFGRINAHGSQAVATATHMQGSFV
ncbi:hypothetical protein N0V88_000996 [Collariella sp. IMI 366227]|nr:hypothetical protein N0V88_000996 [Collariella sp. IMI 366227]